MFNLYVICGRNETVFNTHMDHHEREYICTIEKLHKKYIYDIDTVQ